MAKKISEKNIIECFEKIGDFKLPDSTTKSGIENVRQLIIDRDSKPSLQRPDIWRTIMASKWTKYTTAAMLCIAIIIGVNLIPAKELTAAQILTKVADNMSDMLWRKCVHKTYITAKDETRVDTVLVDYTSKQSFAIMSGGSLHQRDYANNKVSVYLPDENTLTIKPFKNPWLGPQTTIEEYIKTIQDVGMQVTKSQEIRDGVKLTVIEFDEILNNISLNPYKYRSKLGSVKVIRTKLFIDGNLLRLASKEISYVDADNNLVSKKISHDEHIETGPKNIYELGVPDDVKVINQIPGKQVQQLHKKIDEHRSAFIKNYIAVQVKTVVNRDASETLHNAKVIYSIDDKLRVDIFKKQKSASFDLITDRIKLLGRSIQLLKSCVPQHDDIEIQAVRIYDGLWQHNLDRHFNKMFVKKPKRMPEGDMYNNDDIADFGWRKLWWLSEPAHIYQDDFSEQNNLIATEITSQYNNRILPKRLRLYVDPQKDYLTRRYVSEQLLDAPWQQETIDPNELLNNMSEHVRDLVVTEFGQTSRGKWYPKTITTKGYNSHLDGKYKSDFNHITRIYLLQEYPQLTDNFFDPNNLK